MPRHARLDAPGTLHHVIVRGIEKRKIVDDDQDRGEFIERLGEISQITQTVIYAWSLMTNHAHILLRSGTAGLPSFMRKLLTGYAGYYNRRHNRHGHLFQNRYKSIVVEEDAYFKELVRYIHLNPLRAKMVESIASLDQYPWSGHSSIMGHSAHDWHDAVFVLNWFGKRMRDARLAYRDFVEKGIAMGRQPALVGGGLVRSAGGWAEVKALRRIGTKEKGDERILGGGDFVSHVLSEADLSKKYRLANLDREKAALELIEQCCQENGISFQALSGGSRVRQVSKARHELSWRLTEELGLSFAEIARLLGVSTSAVAKVIIEKRINK
ncbi:MAG: transposase [Desulfobacteraceae bacterium]|nr:transposase [Desulfobacteraceae bacterium]